MITMEHGMGAAKGTPQISERVFGLFVGAVLTVLSVAPLVFGRPLKPRLLAFALALAALALVCPVLLKWPKRVWFAIAHKIALVVNLLLLAVMFFLVVTPVAVFFRIVGRDPLRRRLDFKASSYWIARSKEDALGSMQNQF
jgi:hypothetical protein